MHTQKIQIRTILFLTSFLLILTSSNPHLIPSKKIIDDKSKLNFIVCAKEPSNISANNLSVAYKDVSINVVLIFAVALFFILIGLYFWSRPNSFKLKNNKTSIEEKLNQPTWF